MEIDFTAEPLIKSNIRFYKFGQLLNKLWDANVSDHNVYKIRDYLFNCHGMETSLIKQIRSFSFSIFQRICEKRLSHSPPKALNLQEQENELARLATCNFTLNRAPRNQGVFEFLFSEHYKCGHGCEKSPLLTFFWAKTSALTGNGFGLCRIGLCYYEGLFVSRNFEKAALFWQKSCDLNCSNDAYEYGEGIEKNLKKSVELYEKASSNGCSDATGNLAYIYGQGAFGIFPKDYQKCFQMHYKAALNGNTLSMCNLGKCYQKGRGVAIDYEKAVYWYLREQRCGKGTFSSTKLSLLKSSSTLDVSHIILAQKQILENEFRAISLRPAAIRVLLIARYKSPESWFWWEKWPLELFVIVMQTAELIN